jgi:hypothetical protein
MEDSHVEIFLKRGSGVRDDYMRGFLHMAGVPIRTADGERRVALSELEVIFFDPDELKTKSAGTIAGTIPLETVEVDTHLGPTLLKKADIESIRVGSPFPGKAGKGDGR